VYTSNHLSPHRIGLVLCLILLLSACTPAAPPAPQASAPPAAPTATRPPAASPTAAKPAISAPTSAPETAAPEQTDLATSFPLSQPGPYYAGSRSLKLIDKTRDGREIRVTLWYPALKETDADGKVIRHNAKPDPSGAPYPLVLTGPNSGDMLFGEHLATHGLATAIVRFPNFSYGDPWTYAVVDNPQDMLFALDQLAADPPEGMSGVIDTDRTGVAGYSWDGFWSLALSGVRFDPQFYLNWCEQAPAHQPPYDQWYIDYACGLAKDWDAFVAHVGAEITTSDDGLWQPLSDERIRAVMPMAADGAWLYGEKGLAAVDRPTLMVQATEDSPYQPAEAEFIFENLGAPEKGMVSFIGKEHMMVFEPETVKKLQHFAVAFLGYHLQGLEEYQQYFSEEFVSQFPDLAWGVYEK
jgi:predicted dienelactone hydrolase